MLYFSFTSMSSLKIILAKSCKDHLATHIFRFLLKQILHARNRLLGCPNILGSSLNSHMMILDRWGVEALKNSSCSTEELRTLQHTFNLMVWQVLVEEVLATIKESCLVGVFGEKSYQRK